MSAFLKVIIKGLLRFYSLFITPLTGYNCRFYPSCSNYAREAVEQHGVLHGGWLAIKRIARCHPWHPGGVDLVPDAGAPNSCCEQHYSNNQTKHMDIPS